MADLNIINDKLFYWRKYLLHIVSNNKNYYLRDNYAKSDYIVNPIDFSTFQIKPHSASRAALNNNRSVQTQATLFQAQSDIPKQQAAAY